VLAVVGDELVVLTVGLFGSKQQRWSRRELADICVAASFVQQKGGSGKSTICTNLAVHAEDNGETVLIIDLDPQSSAADHPTPAGDLSVRRLADGREFTVVKVYYEPGELEAALSEVGFDDATVTTTGRFFLTGVASAGPGAAG